MIGRNSLLKGAMGALLVLSLASRMMAQQKPSTRGAGVATGEVDHGPEPDPNMPYPSSIPGLDVEWSYSSGDRATPEFVRFRGAHSTRNLGPIYLGWTTGEGSWFANPDDKGRIYTWKNNVLTQTGFRNMDEIPEATVRSLRNLQVPYMLARFGKSAASAKSPVTATGEVDHGPQPDPNMPYPMSWPGLDVQWTYSSGDRATPQNVRFEGAHSTRASGPIYLGWTTEEGSWFANTDEKGRVYIWKNNALTQTSYRNETEIPEATVRRIRNLQEPYMLERFGKSAPPASPPPARQAAKAPQRGDGLFGDPKAVSDALAGLQNQTAAPGSGGITGTGAAVQDGVLTFTSAGNAKASYKVVRPAVMRNAPQSSGITGAWVAMEENGMGILFTVQPDGSVAGREMPAQIIQGLTQSGAR